MRNTYVKRVVTEDRIIVTEITQRMGLMNGASWPETMAAWISEGVVGSAWPTKPQHASVTLSAVVYGFWGEGERDAL